ncbi:MAG: site-2 protease family protein [Patescibacteria group bacterium]|nr:site-2 protease family protein [Patescibacteria group bacterium]
MDIIITFIVLIFSAIVHEVSHGLMAEQLGDDTAREQGRITLNPIPHIDPIGTILVPLLIFFGSGGRFWFGAAKPVPVNFHNLKNPKSGMALVSLAGPLSNFFLAVLFVVPIKLHLTNSVSYPILLMGIYINLLLATFNLVPIPPLDGSKILASFLPDEWLYKILSLERWGFVLVLLFLILGLFGVIFDPVLTVFWNTFHLSWADLAQVLGV